ncbi:MAG: hypothetical protein LW832_10150 [Parachlamydia sp.]|jgi:ribosome-binding protein aMBF1 (putative translation factor)|nr:hypothetical protein [Parachlamydia sp.]
METLQELQEQLNSLLSELIKTAEELRDLSRQVVSEEELAPLQKKQEKLLDKIERTDAVINENYASEIEPDAKKNLHDQLSVFQQLNREFIANLNASHGLIQFELRAPKEDID